MNFGMNEQCVATEAKQETAKELLEQMGLILEELTNEVRMISDAVYRGVNCTTVEKEPDGPRMPPMIVIMKEQRDMAEAALKGLIRIRESLWR